MKIQDFLDSSELQPVYIDGELVEGVRCRLLSFEEVTALIGDGVQNAVKFGAALLTACLVNDEGKPVCEADAWLRMPFAKKQQFEALFTEVSRINGILQAKQVEELGKSSETTGASDSNSNSA